MSRCRRDSCFEESSPSVARIDTRVRNRLTTARRRDVCYRFGVDQRPVGIAVLGSTGSIGRQTLDVIRVARAGGSASSRWPAATTTRCSKTSRASSSRTWSGARRPTRHMDLKAAAGAKTRWAPLEEMAAHPDVDIVVVATGGAAGLAPTIAALRAGKTVALANKEVLVMAGHIVTREAAARPRRAAARRQRAQRDLAVPLGRGQSPRSRS